jgi:biopolymer transport protein ExbB
MKLLKKSGKQKNGFSVDKNNDSYETPGTVVCVCNSVGVHWLDLPFAGRCCQVEWVFIAQLSQGLEVENMFFNISTGRHLRLCIVTFFVALNLPVQISALAQEATNVPPATFESSEPPESMWMQMFDTKRWSNILPMGALYLCSIVALAAILERAFALRRNRLFKQGLTQNVENLLRLGKTKEAIAAGRAAGVLEGDVVAAALEDILVRGENKDIAFGENTALRLEPLGRRLDLLNTCGRIAPLLGLLGTVIGMVEAFSVIASYVDDPPKSEIARGIGTALLTTVVGLCVAIPCVVGESIFTKRAERFFSEIQEKLALIRAATPNVAPAEVKANEGSAV